MTVTDAPIDRLEGLDAKIDVLGEQLARLTADAEYRSRRSAAMDELAGDLGRVSRDAMFVASNELDTLFDHADLADAARLARRLIEVAPTLERSLGALQSIAELVDDVSPLGREAVAMASDRLADAERKGYFGLATAARGVAERVAADVDEHDIDLFGDNVVAMLNALREVTQPEMLAFLTRMIDAVHAEQAAVEREPASAPSLWALAGLIRDPEVRRGIGRALHTLRAVSVETGPTATTRTGDTR